MGVLAEWLRGRWGSDDEPTSEGEDRDTGGVWDVNVGDSPIMPDVDTTDDAKIDARIND